MEQNYYFYAYENQEWQLRFTETSEPAVWDRVRQYREEFPEIPIAWTREKMEGQPSLVFK